MRRFRRSDRFGARTGAVDGQFTMGGFSIAVGGICAGCLIGRYHSVLFLARGRGQGKSDGLSETEPLESNAAVVDLDSEANDLGRKGNDNRNVVPLPGVLT